MASRKAARPQTLTLAELIEGARAYLAQASERVVGLEDTGAPGRHDLTMIEVARDEVREAARLMRRVHDRAARAARRAPKGGR